MDIGTLRATISVSAAVAKEWFTEHATHKTHSDWDARGQLEDNGIGAVYAFFDQAERCLYVGQTTRKLKERANHEMSRHYDTVWWERWTELRFINTVNPTDQTILEALLILALSPLHNTKPAAREINQMFLNN